MYQIARRPVTQDQVFDVIRGERQYQDSRWDPTRHVPHSIEEFCVYMDHYLAEAKRLATLTDFGSYEAMKPCLDAIRKVTALGVACLEQNGAPARVV